MGIEDFRRRLGVSRIVEFSIRITHRFLQNHPYVWTVLLFFFLFYALFPCIISFLLYCFPFFAFVAVLLQIFWTSESLDVRDQEQEHDSKSFIKNVCIDANRSPLTSRRRGYRAKHEGWEGKDVESPAGISDFSMEETGKEISADIVKEIRSSAIASAPDSLLQVQANNHPFIRSEPSMSDFLSFGSLNSQTHKSNGDCEPVSESSSEVEEEAREDGDKAMKWTEDDQKNLMDLGFSEMERNIRLESLIAKRGGRKLIPGPVEEDISAMDFEIAKVSIAKHRHFDDPSNFKEVEGLPIPGSAPSVLLPMRNPFHLAYDPVEEKPNLAVDSFRREFGAANQKELSFCRHGSFCFGTSFPLQSHLHEAMSNPFFSTEKWDGLGNSRFRRSSPSDREDHEWLIDEPLVFKGRQMTNAEIQEKSQDSSSDTTSSSSSEKLEEMFNGDREGAPDHESMTSATQSSRVIKDPVYGLSSLPSNGGKMDDCFSFALNAAHHTATYSIASDLQVEVSEIDSPPMTLDGTYSPTDGESSTYDGDVEKEITVGGEEIWESSSDVCRRIENVIDHVNLWVAGERSEDVTSQWNPFAAAIPDSVDELEPSNISDREMKDKDSVGGEDQSSDSDSEEPGEYQDNAGSDKSTEGDKISDLIGEREKPSTYDDNTELPKPGEDEESEDSELLEISAMATEMEKVQSSSSDEDSTSSAPTDEKPTSKSSKEFEFESEKLMRYEPDFDPAMLPASLPTDTSGEETTPGQFTPAVLSGGDEPAIIGSWSSKPKEEENDSNILKHPAEQENEADLEAPTIVENNSELTEAASLESENSIKHDGPEDEPDPDDINGDPSSPFAKPVEQSSRHC